MVVVNQILEQCPKLSKRKPDPKFKLSARIESDIGDCDYPLISGDGFCDDEANIFWCNFDDGDCCGNSVDIGNCLQCTCFGNDNLLIFS